MGDFNDQNQKLLKLLPNLSVLKTYANSSLNSSHLLRDHLLKIHSKQMRSFGYNGRNYPKNAYPVLRELQITTEADDDQQFQQIAESIKNLEKIHLDFRT